MNDKPKQTCAGCIRHDQRTAYCSLWGWTRRGTDQACPERAESGRAERASWWVAGWRRANNVPNGYRRYGQYAYERLYGRLRTAEKRERITREGGK